MKNIDINRLIEWYKANKRSFPWRDTGDPYDVWLSEIMLQQTRIEAVKPKYLAFKNQLPDIEALANCDDDRLMRLWEGMGYYSRARNLKKCAQYLVQHYQGQLPKDYALLKNLPGIGPYTAGAIYSIAYHLPAPAIDGNVLRVLSRYYGIAEDIRDTKTRDAIAEKLNVFYEADTAQDYSSFNQGLMELGETVCMPNSTPKCDQCPLQKNCYAHQNSMTNTIPYRSPLKKRKMVKRTIVIVRDNHKFLIHKRPPSGLLADLYEFPGVDGHLGRKEVINYVSSLGFTALQLHSLPAAKHIFTHLEWNMQAYEIKTAETINRPDDTYLLVNKEELQFLAIPSAFKKYIDWYSLRD